MGIHFFLIQLDFPQGFEIPKLSPWILLIAASVPEIEIVDIGQGYPQ